MPGTLSETYVAAIQHDLVAPGESTAIGVVRRPTGWFHAAVDENVRELGPAEDPLDEVTARREDLSMAGMCDEEAHNAAWEETDFDARYREYLETDPDALEAVERLRDRIEGGEDVTLVCFESEDKRCHRHTLLEVLQSGP